MCQLRRIMLIEDDLDIQIVARLALVDVAGFELKVCSTGFEALEEASDYAPDLILLDVMMPELDGPSTLKRLREMEGLRTTPVIFMTAKVQPEEVAEYRSLGALEVIFKPFDPMTLGDDVLRVWQQDAARTP